jgi:hypothetical protein
VGNKLKPELSSTIHSLTFGNANGGDLLIYPAVLVVDDWRLKRIALIDLRGVRVEFAPARFVETETPPLDALRVDTTWQYVRNDGMPDRRFANNHQIPVMRYGQLTFTSSTGLYEVYQVSYERLAEDFAKRFGEHVGKLR